MRSYGNCYNTRFSVATVTRCYGTRTSKHMGSSPLIDRLIRFLSPIIFSNPIFPILSLMLVATLELCTTTSQFIVAIEKIEIVVIKAVVVVASSIFFVAGITAVSFLIAVIAVAAVSAFAAIISFVVAEVAIAALFVAVNKHRYPLRACVPILFAVISPKLIKVCKVPTNQLRTLTRGFVPHSVEF